MKMRRIKPFLIVFVVLFSVTLIGTFLFNSMQKGLDQLLTLEMSEIDLSAVEDGTYLGKYSQLPVSVKLTVTVLNHDITAIEILEHDNGQGTAGEAVIDSVIAFDSVLIDTVAGATYSSKVILLAVKDAIENKVLA
jgi:uncharacterized protein with FMN-binding domain